MARRCQLEEAKRRAALAAGASQDAVPGHDVVLPVIRENAEWRPLEDAPYGIMIAVRNGSDQAIAIRDTYGWFNSSRSGGIDFLPDEWSEVG